MSGWRSSICRWNQIQRRRSPVSPSGRRRSDEPSTPTTVRKTVSASSSGTLPIRCTPALRGAVTVSLELEEVFQRRDDGLGIVLVERVDRARDLDEASVRQLLAHALGDVTIQDVAHLAAQDQRGTPDRAQRRPPVEVDLRPPFLDARMPFPDDRAVLALLEARGRDPAIVVDARERVAAIEMLRRLLDALPDVGVGRARRRRGRAG